jgi:hypothetical protein
LESSTFFPSEFRDLAEKSTAQAKENYDKLKSATEEVTGGLKDAYEAATKGTRDYGVRLIPPKNSRTSPPCLLIGPPSSAPP